MAQTYRTQQAKTEIRESLFKMTRGDEDIEGGAPNFFWHPKGGALKICILQNQQEGGGGGAPKKLNR